MSDAHYETPVNLQPVSDPHSSGLEHGAAHGGTAEPHQYKYHRLLRGMPNYRWWKPLLFGLLTAVFGFTFTQFVALFGIIPVLLTEGFDGLLAIEDRLLRLDTQDPLALAIALLSIVVWIPAILLAGLSMGIKPLGRLWSVSFKIRWGLLFRTLSPAILALVVMQTLGILYSFLVNPVEVLPGADSDFDTSAALISLVLVLVLVPLQATAEEFMFRGALMQVLGAWIKNPIIPIAVPSLLFAFAHLYDPWALMQVGAMGVVAGWLTWRTGGLEAAISIHVVNNLVSFLFMLTGAAGDTGQPAETGADWVTVLLQLVALGLYAWLVLRIFKKHEYSDVSREAGLASQSQLPGGPAGPGAYMPTTAQAPSGQVPFGQTPYGEALQWAPEQEATEQAAPDQDERE